MDAQPFWINGEIAIVPRPRGGDWLGDEMLALLEASIDIVVSMLEESEIAELGLDRENVAANHAGIRFINFAVPDRGVPNNLHQFIEFLTSLEKCLAQGQRIGVHCRACIGRSSVVAASLLIRAGIPADQAWHQVESARGSSVPDTIEQLEWVGRHIRPKPC